jgi:hypothetical protein
LKLDLREERDRSKRISSNRRNAGSSKSKSSSKHGSEDADDASPPWGASPDRNGHGHGLSHDTAPAGSAGGDLQRKLEASRVAHQRQKVGSCFQGFGTEGWR